MTSEGRDFEPMPIQQMSSRQIEEELKQTIMSMTKEECQQLLDMWKEYRNGKSVLHNKYGAHK